MKQILSMQPESIRKPEKPDEILITMNGEKISNIKNINFEEILGDVGRCRFEFKFGRKEMDLIIEETFGRKLVAYDGIKNEEPEEKSQKDETTLLYRKAKEIIQEASNQINMPIYYTLSTHFISEGKPNPMRRWAAAENKGKAIFQWDSIRTKKRDGTEYFEKTFTPETNDSEKSNLNN